MPPLEAWEKVLIDAIAYTESTHGRMQNCTQCHGGVDSPDKAQAHAGMIADPSDTDGGVCAKCHPPVASMQSTSLHNTLQGYTTALAGRSDPAAADSLQDMRGRHCDTCHTTCGQCHVSQPNNVGGGLLKGHEFVADPPMSRTCTACHGSRVGQEYTGQNEGLQADVHFRQARMVCTDCHPADNMHASAVTCVDCPDGQRPAQDRYDGPEAPRCETCHPQVGAADDAHPQHTIHQKIVACQVCHSVDYKNCDGCHVARDKAGLPYFETAGSYLTFAIGRNTLQSAERPYEYVLVRHVPIDRDSFSYYGEDLLSNFDALPTWRYSTPHNIQRQTPQNSSCTACHGNASLFLTADRVASGERTANRDVIVPVVPAAP